MNQHGSSSSSSSSSTVDVSSLAIPSDQAHLLQYWDTLSPSEQASLFHQLSSLLDHQQLSQLASIVQSHTAAESSAYLSGTKPATIEPFNNAVHVNQASDKERQIWKDKGFELISHRKVAAILMAGGQGTRLGSNLPKGAIDIGLPSGKCLFQLQAERLIRTAEIAGAVKRIPWFIMTSSATHIQTIEIFKRNNFFGYEENDVVFFQQDDLPCFSDMGKIILESRCKVSIN